MLEIIIAPHPVLKKKADPVEEITQWEQDFLQQMLDAMYKAGGIGLAAPQVNLSKRMLVMDVVEEDSESNPICMVNPKIVFSSEETKSYNEGCLSFPNEYAPITRPDKVRVDYLDEVGKAQSLETDGLLAVCVQHEIDHLDGITFVDHLSRLRRDMIMKRVKKLKEE